MNLRTWAVKWGIPMAALADLENQLGIDDNRTDPGDKPLGSEGRVQSQVLLEADRKGMRLWRNNVGALLDKTGRSVRYGLLNESAKVNKVFKSADLIGIAPVVITPEMIGATIGQFLSIEVKEEGWTYSGDEHENAQLNWANLVMAAGGRAMFVNKEGML